VLGSTAIAEAHGVCVTIDARRDNLGERERAAVRIAILDALYAEGLQVDPDAISCRGWVTAFSVQLGNTISTTIVGGGTDVHGQASSLDELDLLVRQLVRSLVTGRSLATGSGVTDRTNVLRDQTAPRRVDARSSRRWDPVLAVGGGMLELPAIAGRARQRQYDIVSLELREWGFLTSERSALELYGRVLLHDYAVFSTAHGWYRDARDQPDNAESDLGRGTALVFSPFAVANWEGGLGLVSFLGSLPPRPYVRLGATASVLCRFSDPDHRIDLGFGGYAGLGFQLSRTVSVSVAVNASNPLVHALAGSGYWYFLTTTAMLEIRGEGREHTLAPRLLGPEPVPTIRRINE